MTLTHNVAWPLAMYAHCKPLLFMERATMDHRSIDRSKPLSLSSLSGGGGCVATSGPWLVAGTASGLAARPTALIHPIRSAFDWVISGYLLGLASGGLVGSLSFAVGKRPKLTESIFHPGPFDSISAGTLSRRSAPTQTRAFGCSHCHFASTFPRLIVFSIN